MLVCLLGVPVIGIGMGLSIGMRLSHMRGRMYGNHMNADQKYIQEADDFEVEGTLANISSETELNASIARFPALVLFFTAANCTACREI